MAEPTKEQQEAIEKARETTTLTTIAVPTEIKEERANTLLISAFEGGSNYWYRIENDKCVYPEGKTREDYSFWSDIPFVEGASLAVSYFDESKDKFVLPKKRLDRQALIDGLNVMATKYPKHFSDVVNENDDAGTGDVFLQCCLFGEIRFG